MAYIGQTVRPLLIRVKEHESAAGTIRKKMSQNIPLNEDPSNIFAERLANSTRRFDHNTNVDLLQASTESKLLNKLEKLEILKHKNSTLYKSVNDIFYDQILISCPMIQFSNLVFLYVSSLQI